MTWSEINFSLRNLPVRAFDSRAQGFSPPLARQRSSCPPPSPNLVRTHLIENHQALRDSAPCLSRAATLPKATKLELGRGAHLKTPSSANHTAAASQPTGRIAKAASWLHLSRVSPALLPPERPSTLIPRNQVSEGEGTNELVYALLCGEDTKFKLPKAGNGNVFFIEERVRFARADKAVAL